MIVSCCTNAATLICLCCIVVYDTAEVQLCAYGQVHEKRPSECAPLILRPPFVAQFRHFFGSMLTLATIHTAPSGMAVQATRDLENMIHVLRDVWAQCASPVILLGDFNERDWSSTPLLALQNECGYTTLVPQASHTLIDQRLRPYCYDNIIVPHGIAKGNSNGGVANFIETTGSYFTERLQIAGGDEEGISVVLKEIANEISNHLLVWGSFEAGHTDYELRNVQSNLQLFDVDWKYVSDMYHKRMCFGEEL